jgi:hypothetical protein
LYDRRLVYFFASSFFGSDELGAIVLDDEELEVSGAFASLDVLGAGAVGAGDAVDVLDELDDGLVAGGVAVVDF